MAGFSITSILQYTIYSIVAYILIISPLLTIILPTSWLSTTAPESENSTSLSTLFLPPSTQSCPDHTYRTTILSRSPLIVYIHAFLSPPERSHLLALSDPHWSPSPIYAAGSIPTVDTSVRNSSRAPLSSDDLVVACIAGRALDFQGWPDDTFVEQIWTQRYLSGGHYGHHFDWAGDLRRRKAGRVSTFMVYVGCEGCKGGGTRFPRLPKVDKEALCDVVECEQGEGEDGLGVTFKPVAGNAIYWENFRPDGKGWEELWHAALPVEEGVKVGLNIWSWFQEGLGATFKQQNEKDKEMEQQQERVEL